MVADRTLSPLPPLSPSMAPLFVCQQPIRVPVFLSVLSPSISVFRLSVLSGDCPTCVFQPLPPTLPAYLMFVCPPVSCIIVVLYGGCSNGVSQRSFLFVWLWPLAVLCPLLSSPHETVSLYGGRQVGGLERGMWAAGGVNPTSRLHQIQKNHLPSRCTQQRSDGTGWWPHHCPPHHASLAPVALQPFAAESLEGEEQG